MRYRRFALLCVLALALLTALVLSAAGGITELSGQEDDSQSAIEVSQSPAQTADGAQPLSQVRELTMPPVDDQDIVEGEKGGPGGPYQFAVPLGVDKTPSKAGTWETLEDSTRLWRLRVSSPGALSLNLGFDRYVMPAGGSLLVYSPDHATVIGPFTEADNEAHGQLWTPIITGDEIVVEVRLPAAVESQLELSLAQVSHGYRGFGAAPEQSGEKSGSCNVDVVCSQGNAWRDEIRSVARYTRSGIYLCSGALVNNTAQDKTPYFLTADHCGVSSSNASTVVAYWNYQNSTCRTPGSPASGQAGNGQLNQFNTGAYFRADYSPTDMTLLELDDPVNQAYNVHYAGWSRKDVAPASATAIHHPQGEEKRISFENDATTITSYLWTSVPGDSTHIRVTDWDVGTTEPGSSGSPLFNPSHRIVGQLHGGYAACSNNLSDWYGRFHGSWDGGGTASSRLRDWLDPTNTGVTALAGRDAVGSPDCYILSTSVRPGGGGSVTRSPTSSGSCPNGQYTPGTVVRLTADPDTNFRWSSWSGTANNGVNPTTVTMNRNRSVTARFSVVTRGYWLGASDGGIFAFGDAPFYGSTGAMALNQPIVGMAATPSGNGYWLVASDGGIFAFGDAAFHGSTGAIALNQPIVGMAATPSGNGYWLVASDGGIFAFGDAAFFGSTGAMALNQPIVGMAATPTGNGYWLVASDGGIFAFGDAVFYGSTGAIALNQPIVGMAARPSGNGYWLVATDGGIFAFGDAGFHGSTGAIALNQPIVGMAATSTGTGYWLIATDGGIFAFGDAAFFGSTGAIALNQPIVGMAPRSAAAP